MSGLEQFALLLYIIKINVNCKVGKSRWSGWVCRGLHLTLIWVIAWEVPSSVADEAKSFWLMSLLLDSTQGSSWLPLTMGIHLPFHSLSRSKFSRYSSLLSQIEPSISVWPPTFLEHLLSHWSCYYALDSRQVTLPGWSLFTNTLSHGPHDLNNLCWGNDRLQWGDLEIQLLSLEVMLNFLSQVKPELMDMFTFITLINYISQFIEFICVVPNCFIVLIASL